MTAFNVRRCYAVVHYMFFSEYRKLFLNLTLGLTLGLFCLGFSTYSIYVDGFGKTDYSNVVCRDIADSQWLMFYVASFAVVGGTFARLHTKQKRIAYLMLPATNAEKFVSRIVLVVLGYLVSFAISLVAADVLRQLYSLINGHDAVSVLPYFVDDLSPFGKGWYNYSTGEIRWMQLTAVVGLYMWAYSCYLLGSIVFRRRAFIKTVGVQLLSFFLLAIFIGSLNGSFRIIIRLGEYGDLIDKLFIVGLYVFSVLHVWLAYWLHRRMAVIPRRFTLKSFFVRRSTDA